MMVATARRISANNLSERLPVTNPGDEFGSLATTINHLLERVRRSFEQLKRFTADASHELRTPLTAIRSVGEIALQRERTATEYRETIGSMLEENSRLTDLVDQLLFLSRADEGRLPLHPESIDLSEMLREVAELMSVLAEEKGQTISVQGPANLSLVADKTLLRQAIMDVIDNAVKHSDSGNILVCATEEADKIAQIDIEDHGPGIPIEDRHKVFERFHRVEKGRSSTSGGTGLGLSIVQWIVRAHAGTAQVLESPQGGTILRIRIPMSADRQALSSRD
jgi:heavy metal sensor kinase